MPQHPGFWSELALPIIGLSPMDDVTDHPYRFIQKKYGQPALIYTEFTSVEGVCHGALQLLKDFLFDETQRPIVAQIYGTTPDFFRQTATLLCELGFDGIDINMGCPAKTVASSGAGAALIKNPQLAQEIVTSTKAGVMDWVNGKSSRDCPDIVEKIWREVERRHELLPPNYQQRRSIPVSVKTRVGYDEKIASTWIPQLLETEPVAIAIHGRTLKQAYGGSADWEEIGKAVAVAKSSSTLILGNGDVTNYDQALEKVSQYGVAGVLIGRGSFGNPFVFQPAGFSPAASKFQIALEHAQLFESTFQDNPKYNFLPMRKHLGWYVREISNAKEVRMKLFQTNSAAEVAAIFSEYKLLS